MKHLKRLLNRVKSQAATVATVATVATGRRVPVPLASNPDGIHGEIP